MKTACVSSLHLMVDLLFSFSNSDIDNTHKFHKVKFMYIYLYQTPYKFIFMFIFIFKFIENSHINIQIIHTKHQPCDVNQLMCYSHTHLYISCRS